MTTHQPYPQAPESPSGEGQDAALARHSAGKIKHHVFPKGTVLFARGEGRHCAYLIDQGEVNIIGNDEGGADKLLCTLGEGEIFGEMALIDDSPRSAMAVTASEAEIFIIPRAALQDRVKGLDPILSLLMALLIERYKVTRMHLPESIRQDRFGDFMQKISRNDQGTREVLRMRNSKELREVALREMKVEQELRAGLEQRQFVPVFQPILNLPGRTLAGFETLIRWQHPVKGMIFPDNFIPVAERTGVVQQLDRLMLEKVCEYYPVLREKAGPNGADFFISVNLSGTNFENYDVINTVRSTLIKSDVDPAHIKLEITESALIGDAEHAEKILQGLKAIGVTIALDDFGTGYSSLGYLHKFSIDDIKIDRSFVSQIADGSKSIDIIRAIIALARNFKLRVVAEGIEQEADVTALNALGCDMGQGYLFSKPLSLADTVTYLETNHR